MDADVQTWVLKIVHVFASDLFFGVRPSFHTCAARSLDVHGDYANLMLMREPVVFKERPFVPLMGVVRTHLVMIVINIRNEA